MLVCTELLWNALRQVFRENEIYWVAMNHPHGFPKIIGSCTFWAPEAFARKLKSSSRCSSARMKRPQHDGRGSLSFWPTVGKAWAGGLIKTWKCFGHISLSPSVLDTVEMLALDEHSCKIHYVARPCCWLICHPCLCRPLLLKGVASGEWTCAPTHDNP